MGDERVLTTKTTEERVTSLEENFAFMREGMTRVERMLEKLDTTVSSLVDRLDTRYPSKESVDLRLAELVRDIKVLRERQDALEARAARMSAWQYRVAGALVVISFAVGVLSRYWGW
ncbi:MAG: hypothetical protein ACYCYO_01940 [Bacilli bacterium]